MHTISTKNHTDENAIHGLSNVICGCHPWMEKCHPWMERCHLWMEKCHPWMLSMDGEMSSMDGSVIRGCHPWMPSMDEDDGWRTWTQPISWHKRFCSLMKYFVCMYQLIKNANKFLMHGVWHLKFIKKCRWGLVCRIRCTVHLCRTYVKDEFFWFHNKISDFVPI